MHVACINARKDAVKALVAHGAATDKTDRVGDRPADCIPTNARHAKHLRRVLGVAEPEREGRSEGKEIEDGRRREEKEGKASWEEKQQQ